MKRFYIMFNVGRCKYCVNFHDGVQKHKDGSEFFDTRIFKNKKAMGDFIATLRHNGYQEGRP